MQYFMEYLAAINALAVFLTVHDKHNAKKHRWRISEATLLTVAALGGSPMMLLTMKLIRHKTQHKKFMLGIPLIFTLQIAVMIICCVLW